MLSGCVILSFFSGASCPQHLVIALVGAQLSGIPPPIPIASQLFNFISCIRRFERNCKFLQMYGTDEPHRKVGKGILISKCINFLRNFFFLTVSVSYCFFFGNVYIFFP